MRLNSHLHLVPKLRIGGLILPRQHMTSCNTGNLLLTFPSSVLHTYLWQLKNCHLRNSKQSDTLSVEQCMLFLSSPVNTVLSVLPCVPGSGGFRLQ